MLTITQCCENASCHTTLYKGSFDITTRQNVSVIYLGLSYENTENKKEAVKPESEGRIESFKPTVSASHRENEDLISPWDWKLPIMSTTRHSATTFTLGTVFSFTFFEWKEYLAKQHFIFRLRLAQHKTLFQTGIFKRI